MSLKSVQTNGARRRTLHKFKCKIMVSAIRVVYLTLQNAPPHRQQARAQPHNTHNTKRSKKSTFAVTGLVAAATH